MNSIDLGCCDKVEGGPLRDSPGGPGAETLHSQCRGPGSTPGQRTRPHTPPLRCRMSQLEIARAVTKTHSSQRKGNTKKKKKNFLETSNPDRNEGVVLLN